VQAPTQEGRLTAYQAENLSTGNGTRWGSGGRGPPRRTPGGWNLSRGTRGVRPACHGSLSRALPGKDRCHGLAEVLSGSLSCGLKPLETPSTNFLPSRRIVILSACWMPPTAL